MHGTKLSTEENISLLAKVVTLKKTYVSQVSVKNRRFSSQCSRRGFLKRYQKKP